MALNRREFMEIMVAATLSGVGPSLARAANGAITDAYEVPAFGNARVLHFADCHAQLMPIYFREPNVNLGVGNAFGKPPHLVGEHLLKHFDIEPGSIDAHAFTHLDFSEAARTFGKVGGFSHLATLVKQLRGAVAPDASILLDSGDTWQGSWTAFQTRGMDMVGASNLLGVDVMTGHWEFTYLAEEVLKNIAAFNGDFVAQNVRVTEEALFDGSPAYDEDTGHTFKPYVVKEVSGKRIAIVGQAFPYTPIANPGRFIPDWTFGIREAEMSDLVTTIRDEEQPDALILLSHNGMDVDLKLASRVSGIDAILGGHTHDAVVQASVVSNPGGKTIVGNAGSNGKYLAVLDLDIGKGKVNGYQYRLLPIFANLLEADSEMAQYVEGVRAPHLNLLNEGLATTDSLLYRRGNFIGSFDQVICDALRATNDAQIALSPGFRWGTSLLPGDTIRYENVLDQTCMTYPETYARDMTGEDLKLILEDVADNLFNPDPYRQQGGDMVRAGGLRYVLDPNQTIGNRITDMQLRDGTPIDAGKSYRVAGWATVGAKSPGPPVWEQVADYLRSEKEVRIDTLESPVVRNANGNPGFVAL